MQVKAREGGEELFEIGQQEMKEPERHKEPIRKNKKILFTLHLIILFKEMEFNFM